jgi:hypothetical protein
MTLASPSENHKSTIRENKDFSLWKKSQKELRKTSGRDFGKEV